MNLKLRHLVFYLFLISLVATGISFSRFSTTLTNSGAESTVPGTEPGIEFSTWVLEHEVENWSIPLKDLVPGDSGTIKILVKNWKIAEGIEKVSDYTQRLELELETTGNLPLKFTLKEKRENSWENMSLYSNGFNRYLSESKVFTSQIKETKEFELTVTWPEDEKDEPFKDEIDYIQIGLKVTQSEVD